MSGSTFSLVEKKEHKKGEKERKMMIESDISKSICIREEEIERNRRNACREWKNQRSKRKENEERRNQLSPVSRLARVCSKVSAYEFINQHKQEGKRID